jgi:hypothetical protein
MVDEVAKQAFVQNNHRNSLLIGKFVSTERTFGAGDYYVPMNHRLANLAFYLLEPQADDGLAYWNFFDSALERGLENGSRAELESSNPVEYPVFKVFP